MIVERKGDQMIGVKKLALIMVTLAAVVLCAGPALANLVINGGFEDGNTGFTSDYIYSTSSGFINGYYAIGSNPSAYNGAWTDITAAHGGTNMMIVNGATNGTSSVWSAQVTVESGTYKFSAWVANSFTGMPNPANFTLKIGGGTITSFALGRYTKGWQEFSTNWISTSGGTVTLALVDTATGENGNDFVLDDITFARVNPVPIPGAVWLLGSGLLGLVAIKRKFRK